MKKTDSIAKVTVVTRTKDRPLLLERAIKSVHRQTMPDFIHVIINDAGDLSMVNNLVDKYKGIIKGRVRVINNAKSRGMEAASNKAIKAYNSIYVAIHDDDDSWHKDFLKVTTNYLDSSSAIMGVVVSTDCITEQIKGKKIKTIKTERWIPGTTDISLYQQCFINYATPITFLYRRSVFKTIGYYDESLPVNGDWEFALRFLLHYDIDFIESEHALAFYHHRPKNKGVEGNSVFADRKLHDHNMNALGNKFLRKDISEGKLGIGFIINSMRDQHQRETPLQSQIYNQLSNDIRENISVLKNQLEAKIDFLQKNMTGKEEGLSQLVFERTSLVQRIQKLFSRHKKP